MSDFETLKELKICYEYINDLLDNCDYISNEDYNTRNSLHKTLNVLQDLYSNCYEVMASNKESYEDLKMDIQDNSAFSMPIYLGFHTNASLFRLRNMLDSISGDHINS